MSASPSSLEEEGSLLLYPTLLGREEENRALCPLLPSSSREEEVAILL